MSDIIILIIGIISALLSCIAIYNFGYAKGYEDAGNYCINKFRKNGLK